MEILMLILLYCLSQNPDFPESVKPLMGQLKNSEQMLCFLNDLSKFTQTFSTLKNQDHHKDPPPPPKKEEPKKDPPKEKKEEERKSENKEPQSPTAGIADEFIQQILEGYLNKR